MTIRLKQNVPCTPANSLLYNNVCWAKFVVHNMPMALPYKAKPVNNCSYVIAYGLDVWFRYTNKEEVSSAKFVATYLEYMDSKPALIQLNKIVDEINVG